MPNIAIGLCIGLAAWTVCMGSTVLSGGFNNTASQVLPSSNITHLKDYKDVKQRNKELPCIGNLFGEIEWNASNVDLYPMKNQNTKGCLAVWWEKDTYENTNWKGSWNFLWGMRDDSYGIIFSQNIKANDGKLSGDAAFHSLYKKQDKWSLLESVVLADNKKEEIIKNIPTPGGQVIDHSEGWKFDFDSKKICSKDNQCESESPIHKSVNLIWNFVAGSENEGTGFAYESVRNIYHDFKVFIERRLSGLRGFFKLAS